MFIIKEGVEPEKIGEGTSPETVEAISKWLESQGRTIRTAEEDTSFISQKAQEEVDAMYRKHNETIDTALAELTGIKKNANEKTTDYMKRAVSSYGSQVTELQEKIDKYEKEGVSGHEQAEKYRKQLEDLQEQFRTQSEKHAEELRTQKEVTFKNQVHNNINKEYESIKSKLRDDINKDVIDDVLENRLRKFYEENTPEQLDDEHVIWKDKDGKTINSTKDGKPLSGVEILNGYFKDLVQEKRNDKGSGSNGGEGGKGEGQENPSYKDIKVPDTVKSKTQLHDYLSKDLKMDQSTKEFSEAYEALGKDLPLRAPR